MECFIDSGPIDTPEVCTPGLYRHVADDANRQAENLLGWSQLYDQLSGGGFSGEISGARFGAIHLFRESTNLSLRQSCVVRSDGWWFGVPVSDSDSFRIDSRRMSDGAVAVRRGHRPFELITPANFDIYGLVIRHETLLEHLRSLNPGQDDLLRLQREALQVDGTSRSALRDLFQQMLQEVARRPALLSTPAACRAMQNSILDAVAGLCVSAGHSKEITTREIHNSLMVRNVRQYVLDHDSRVISVSELCKVISVSRRTLQYAFEQVLGISPNLYLKILRLNGARRDLCRRGEGRVPVQQVASDWGFWHLSQFAKDYRSLFHELPSETLRRTAAGRG